MADQQENPMDITLVPDEESVEEIDEFNFEDAMKVRKNLSEAFDRHATASVAETIARFEAKQPAVRPPLAMASSGYVGDATSCPYTQNSSSLSVWLRVRPPVAKEDESKVSTIEILSCDGHVPSTIRTFPPFDSNANRVNRDKINGVKQYEFQQVFGPASTQHEIYSTVAAPLVHSLFGDAGESALLFCYGITNAGKSYTTMGDAQDQSKWGIIPRALQDIFARLEGTGNISLYMSYLEIYNEHVHDLLPDEEQPSYERRATLKIREQQDGESFVAGLSKHRVGSIQHGLELVQQAKNKRHTSSNNINADSSRSHCICQLELSSGVKLWVVDLAGSERTKRTAAGATRQKEATLINTSLMTLMRCLSAMQHHHKMVPYRESKLTQLFMSHLTSKSSSRTTMIVNVNPAAADYDETQHVLGYAVAAKSIVFNKEDYIKKRKDMGLFDMNGRKASTISRLVRKYSPKVLMKKRSTTDDYNSNKRKVDGDSEVPVAKVPRADSDDSLRKKIKSLEASLSISQAEVEGLRLQLDEQSEELAELEERVRMEVSDEMEQHFSSTRDEYERIIENLQNQVKNNPVGARSEKKAKMDKAEQMIEELVDKVEECEEEMIRMRAEFDTELHRLQAESRMALEAKDGYIRKLQEEHDVELNEVQASKDDMTEMYKDQIRELEEQLEIVAEEKENKSEAMVESEEEKDYMVASSAANETEDESESNEDSESEYNRENIEESKTESAVENTAVKKVKESNTLKPRRMPRSRASKVACNPDSIPKNAPERQNHQMKVWKQPFGFAAENSDDDLMFPKKEATFDEDDGIYIRPLGRAPRGREWDSQKGAWRLSSC